MTMPKSVTELQEEILKGRKVVDIVEDYLAVVDEKNEEINAFITITRDQALEKAKKVDIEISKNPEILKEKPLFGIPIAYKDIFMTKDVRTTAASKVLENYIAQYSATVVEKIEEEGLISLGKLNCDAWAHGSSGENSDFGPTKNPADLEYVSGGSSSGSAAAVASGMVPLTTGTDTGGSIRLPASFCGVVGFKPTYGRVSRYGVISMASSLDSVGHFANSVEDIAKLFEVTSGKDVNDANTANSI